MKRLCLSLAFFSLPVAANAQVTELPDAAMDGLMRVTLATTAKEECAGAKVDDTKLQMAMLEVMTGLAQDGVDPVAAVKFLETPEGQKAFAEREALLRQKHGVASDGYEALCDAIAREAAEDAALAEIVTLK